MSESTFTFRVDEDLKKEFSAVARSIDRSGAQLLRDFMRDYVKQQKAATEYEKWFHEQVNLGLEAVKAGDLISHDEVEEEAERWRAELRERIGK